MTSYVSRTIRFFVVFNATFNNISVISWRSVLLANIKKNPNTIFCSFLYNWFGLVYNFRDKLFYYLGWVWF